MEKRKIFLHHILFFATLLNFFTLHCAEIGTYGEPAVKTKIKAKKTGVTPEPVMISYGSIIRLQNEDNSLFLGLEKTKKEQQKAALLKMGGKESAVLDTYWYVQPEKDIDENIKYKFAIRNGGKIRLVNVVNGKVFKNHPWIVEAKETIEKYWKKDQRFTLRDPATGAYLTASLTSLGDTGLYGINVKETLSPPGMWIIKDFHPAMLERELVDDDIVTIQSLVNGKFFKHTNNFEIIGKRTNNPSDMIIIEQLLTPIDIEPSKESQFTIKRESGAITFKLNDKYIQSSPASNKGWDKEAGKGPDIKTPWGWTTRITTGVWMGNIEYHPFRGLLRLWPKEKNNMEKFRIEKFFIKDYNKGYLTYLGTLKNRLDKFGDRKRSNYNYEDHAGGAQLNYPIVSAYDDVLFGEGKINKKNPFALFAIQKISGESIKPFIPEAEEEVGYGLMEEEAEIKLSEPLAGKYTNWKEVEKPGIAAITFLAKALDNIIVGFAPEEKDYKKGAKIYEVIIGAGLGEKANTYSLVTNKHFGKATDKKIGTYKMGRNIPNREWNPYWVKVVGKNVSFGTGEIPGENAIIEWTDPRAEETLVKYIGLSNIKNPIYFKNIKYSTPEITEEVKIQFFKNKLKNARKIKVFKNKVNRYIELISLAIESDLARNALIEEIAWLAQNTPKEKMAELQQLINSARWNPKLVNDDPLRQAILGFLAVQSGIPVRFSKKVDAIENLLNLAYTQPTAKIFLTKHKNNIAKQIRAITDESIDESPETKNRIKAIIDTAIYEPAFAEHETAFSTILTELETPLTIEALQERIEAQTATQTNEAEKRFMKTATQLITDEIKKIKTELIAGPLSDESRTTLEHIAYLLKSIKFGLEFDTKHKNEAINLLTKLPAVEIGITEIVAPEEKASVIEKIAYLVSATRNNTFKSEELKKAFFETLSQIISQKDKLTPEQFEQMRIILDMIKWHKNINDQEDALIKYYLSQLAIPVTLDDKVNQLLKDVLAISDDATAKKSFLGKIDKIIKTAQKEIEEKKKVESLSKLERLLKTMKNLPKFATEKDIVKEKLTTVSELIKKQSGIEEKKALVVEKKAEDKKKEVQAKPQRRRRRKTTRKPLATQRSRRPVISIQ